MESSEPSKRKQIVSWCLFDFANSSFTTAIVTAVYPVYFEKVVAAGRDGAQLWNIAAFISNLAIVFLSPVVGAIADHAANKKRYLLQSFILCIAASASLFFCKAGDVGAAMSLFIVANVAFSIGENLIAGFLPDLAEGEDIGRISAHGWATGYAGALISLVPCLWLASIGTDAALRSTNLVVAGFFLLGGLPTFLWVRERRAARETEPLRQMVLHGFRQIGHTWRNRAQHAALFRFLGAYTSFNIGVYGVISCAGLMASRLIGMTQEEIIVMFIVTQISAGIGAIASGRACARFGSVRTVAFSLLLWTTAGTMGFLAHERPMFWCVALLAGLAMGISLPAARTVVGEMAPPEQSAEIFGFWGLCARFAAILAAGGNALLLGLTGGNLRAGIAFFTLSFVVGLLLLRPHRFAARAPASNEPR